MENYQTIHLDRLIELEVLSPKPLLVFADSSRLAQVITNYLINALKYSDESHPVQLQIQSTYLDTTVTVVDQDPGLSPEEQKHIWERFYRAKDVIVLSGHGIGLGIGLYISRHIIEQHQGSVGVRSQTGVGSAFWFSLPLPQS